MPVLLAAAVGAGVAEPTPMTSANVGIPMPANLTQQYRKAEEEYRRAATPEEELRCLQLMLREVPKHKGTDKLQADLKQKISAIKKECEAPGSAGKRRGLRIPRQGAGRVVLLGGPNAGKSQLVRAVTRAEPAVADYPFTTHESFPAMMPWEDIMVQLIDTPPITRDVLDPQIQGLIRGADLTLLLVDLGSEEGIEQCFDVLDRLDETKTRLGCQSYLDESDLGLSFTQSFFVPNKMDCPEASLRLELLHEERELDLPEYQISAQSGAGLDVLKRDIFESLDVVRVYTKLPSAKEPDYDKPFTVRQGGTVGDVAAMVHKDFAANLKFARVWGSQVHDGTSVQSDYVVHDRDVLELHTN